MFSWFKDEVVEEKFVKEGKEKVGKEGKDKWKERVKESKEKSKKNLSFGKGYIDEELEMIIFDFILDEDFCFVIFFLGFYCIKMCLGFLFFFVNICFGFVYVGIF